MSVKKKALIIAGIVILCLCLGFGGGYFIGRRVQKQSNDNSTTELVNRLLSELATAVTKSQSAVEQSEKLESDIKSLQTQFDQYVTRVDKLDESRREELQRLKSSIDSNITVISSGISSIGGCENTVDICIQLTTAISRYIEDTSGASIKATTGK